MMETKLDDRCYWIASSAYTFEQSAFALQTYNRYQGIGNMVMEVYCTKERTLKAMN
jgi:hypothetical protein